MTVRMKTLRPIGHAYRTSFTAQAHSWQPARLIRPTNHCRQPRPHVQHQRSFLSNPFINPFSSEPQTVYATRTFPYSAHQIFAVISDVGSYSQYFPFCQHSVVTQYSQPAANGQRYPEEAKLVVGFDQASEEFWSRIYCVPESVVEAVSGRTETTLPADKTGHHHARLEAGKDPTRTDSVLTHLLTRWTLHPADKETTKTDVSLNIEFQFANPVYAALSQAAVPRAADKMIEAFEKRLRDVIGPQRGR